MKIIATINLSNASEATFINAMQELWSKANTEYRRIYDEVAVPNSTAYNMAYFDRLMTTTEERARKFAETKWKTEKRREQYVREELKNVMAKKNSWKPEEYRPLSYLDFDVNPGSNGLSGNCCLSKFTNEELAKCYQEIKDNKYFKAATAISIGYTESGSYRCYDDGLCHFRPQVVLTMPENMTKMWSEEKEQLANAIAEFYKVARYCGD